MMATTQYDLAVTILDENVKSLVVLKALVICNLSTVKFD